MSYVSNDNRLWFNLTGCVAAYQPVGAPGPVMARYNQAQGGNNRYKAVDGVAPTFRYGISWRFTDGSNQYLSTGIIITPGDWTLIIRFTISLTGVKSYIFGAGGTTNGDLYLAPNYSTNPNGAVYGYGNSFAASGAGTGYSQGVAAVTKGIYGYKDGLLHATAAASPITATGNIILIGAVSTGASTRVYGPSDIYAAAVYNRSLSSAEIWSISKQMVYCQFDPDFSAWGRRRQWYYLAAAGGAVGIYGKRHEVALPGGVRIEATTEAVIL